MHRIDFVRPCTTSRRRCEKKGIKGRAGFQRTTTGFVVRSQPTSTILMLNQVAPSPKLRFVSFVAAVKSLRHALKACHVSFSPSTADKFCPPATRHSAQLHKTVNVVSHIANFTCSNQRQTLKNSAAIVAAIQTH